MLLSRERTESQGACIICNKSQKVRQLPKEQVEGGGQSIRIRRAPRSEHFNELQLPSFWKTHMEAGKHMEAFLCPGFSAVSFDWEFPPLLFVSPVPVRSTAGSLPTAPPGPSGWMATAKSERLRRSTRSAPWRPTPETRSGRRSNAGGGRVDPGSSAN